MSDTKNTPACRRGVETMRLMPEAYCKMPKEASLQSYRANCVGSATNTEYPHRVNSYRDGDGCVFAEYSGGRTSYKATYYR
jgi:hypothetical protein